MELLAEVRILLFKQVDLHIQNHPTPMSTILLVEDNELNRDMLTRRLGRKGDSVILAVDGQQAVKMATTSPNGLLSIPD